MQCALAKHSYARLLEYARVQMQRDYASKKGRANTPIEVVADCVTFLSAAGVIAKILFPTSTRSRAKIRGPNLRRLLKVPDSLQLNSTLIRNAFEHIDDRIDEVIQKHSGQEIALLHVARPKPKSPIVMKHFDPDTVSLSFLGKSIALGTYYSEILLVEKLTQAALDHRPHDSVNLYSR